MMTLNLDMYVRWLDMPRDLHYSRKNISECQRSPSIMGIGKQLDLEKIDETRYYQTYVRTIDWAKHLLWRIRTNVCLLLYFMAFGSRGIVIHV